MLYSKDTKALENLCRRAAVRQGYRLVRNPQRDPLAIGFGMYSLVSVPPRARYAGTRRGQFDERHEAVVLENVPLADVSASSGCQCSHRARLLKVSESLASAPKHNHAAIADGKFFVLETAKDKVNVHSAEKSCAGVSRFAQPRRT